MPLKLKLRGGIYHIHGTVGGQRVRKSLGTRDKEIAEASRAEEEARLARAAIYGAENEATFADACLVYFKHQAPERERHYLRPIIKAIGKQRMATIKPGQIRMLAQKLFPHYKPQTWNRHVIKPVSAAINYAHQAGLCAPIRIRRFPEVDVKIRSAIDRSWIDQFMGSATPHLGAFALFMFTTAARPKEAIFLRPDHLDLDNLIAISDPTKNGQRRIFYLTKEMADILRALPPKVVMKGQYRGEMRVFGWAERHGPEEPWKKCCERAGIVHVTPYEAGRHSFATEAIVRQERNVVSVAHIGNWKDPRVLMKHYAHPERIHEFVEGVFGEGKDTKQAHTPGSIIKMVKK